MVCSLCTDPETDDNLIFTCQKCSVSVHALCYGIKNPGLGWLCSPCQKGISKSVMCELCHQKSGAFKPTTCGKWVHSICALFLEGVTFVNITKMEPVNISQVSKSKRNKMCSFCAQKKGFCGYCSKHKCTNRIHITCAQQNKCLEEVENKTDNSLKFYAFCMEHKPKNSKRLSIGFSTKMVEKKEKEKMRAQSSNQNAHWLVNTVFYDKQNALKTIKENTDHSKEKPSKKNVQIQKQIKQPLPQTNTTTAKGMIHKHTKIKHIN